MLSGGAAIAAFTRDDSNPTHVSIHNSKFNGLESDEGAALYVHGNGTYVTVTDSLFEDGTAADGGAVLFSKHVAAFVETIFITVAPAFT